MKGQLDNSVDVFHRAGHGIGQFHENIGKPGENRFLFSGFSALATAP
jgi:hypothetical protein